MSYNLDKIQGRFRLIQGEEDRRKREGKTVRQSETETETQEETVIE